MSEQTDPLAQLLSAHEWDAFGAGGGGSCRCGWTYTRDNAQDDPPAYSTHKAVAIRAAVLADPTIVGMEAYVWEWPPLPGERTPTFVRRPRTDGVGTPLYRTPEVKG